MRKIAIAIILMILMLLQTGCWNAREINELAFVLCIGLDKADEGFRVTAQISRPDTHSKTPSGGGGSEKDKPFWLISTTGKTIFEAIRNMASMSSRRIFWSHIKVIVISEQLAKSNTLEIFDFFSRNPELRLRTLIAVTPGEAEKLLEFKPMMEKDPALYMEKIIENRSLTGKNYSIMLKDFLEDYLDPYAGPVTSRIFIDMSEPEPVLKIDGAYVFDDNKLAGSLNAEETKGLLWVKNKISDSVMVVNCPYDGLPVTLEIKKAKADIKSYLDNGTVYFTIKVTTDASLVEQGCATDFNDIQKLDGLKRAQKSAIKKNILSTIKTAQKFNVDFLGLSRKLHSQNKDEWHQVSADWQELFKNAQANVIVEADIPYMSLAKPLVPLKTSGGNEE
jgi:spore germination protein KC